jgi:hypothetical protein
VENMHEYDGEQEVRTGEHTPCKGLTPCTLERLSPRLVRLRAAAGSSLNEMVCAEEMCGVLVVSILCHLDWFAGRASSYSSSRDTAPDPCPQIPCMEYQRQVGASVQQIHFKQSLHASVQLWVSTLPSGQLLRTYTTYVRLSRPCVRE